MTAADPASPLSFPLSTAGGVCPRCNKPWRFDARIGKPGLDGRDLRCVCGAVLGRYVERAAGLLWLQVAGVPMAGIDAIPP